LGFTVLNWNPNNSWWRGVI